MLDAFIIDLILERLRREQRSKENRPELQLPILEPQEEKGKPVIKEEPILIDMS